MKTILFVGLISIANGALADCPQCHGYYVGVYCKQQGIHEKAVNVIPTENGNLILQNYNDKTYQYYTFKVISGKGCSIYVLNASGGVIGGH